MPKRLPENLIQRIVRAVAARPEGASIEDIDTALKKTVARRTLQRRLGELVAAGTLSAEGRAKARRYRVVEAQAVPVKTQEVVPPIEVYVPMSPEGEEIRTYLRRPIQERTPVGYDRTLLESYRPNKTFYLSSAIREHLRSIGTPPDGERPAGTYARSIFDRLLIDLSWASSHLEGNTYSRLDTKNLIELGQHAEGKDRREAQMILNHKAAIELLVENAGSIGFDTFTFFNLHAALADNLLSDASEAGRLRTRIVEISGTVFHPLGIPQQIEEYFRLILEKTNATRDPFEQAFFTMVHVPYLQPFVDVNKRVSRLSANVPLIPWNLCPLSFVDVPERAYFEGTLGVYELGRVDLLRDVFVWAYERSCQRYTAIRQTVAEPDPVRLHHREQLIALVGDVVRGGDRPTRKALLASARALGVPKEDRDRFAAMVLEDLANLHEGNIARYRLRLSEYLAWRPAEKR
jgi:hypothetical protein